MKLHLIEPLGFALNTKKMRRIGMDYSAQVALFRHVSFAAFELAQAGKRLVLATTRAPIAHWQHSWRSDDILLLGQESAGVPERVHQRADVRVSVPMTAMARSLNLAAAATLICGEWQRQMSTAPKENATAQK